MFNSLSLLPSDPILGLMQKYKRDPNPQKIDLGVGIYKDEQGCTPVLASVKQAEEWLLGIEDSKAYVGPAGNIEFNCLISALSFGAEHPVIIDNRLATLQTPGGCGALRIAAELIRRSKPDSTIWVSTPTWANHIPLLGDAGIQIAEYPYYDYAQKEINFAAMLSTLEKAARGDLVLLHGCCHNPSGADLSIDQWNTISDLCLTQGLIPFIDMAYQGFGSGIEEDRFGLALMAESQPEVIFALSCSKNFGLYRERVGAVGVVCSTSLEKDAAFSHMLSIVRGIYSMPPSHGASIVARILSNEDLKLSWLNELSRMRLRISDMRTTFCTQMESYGLGERFTHVLNQNGMFSFLGISPEEVSCLAEEFSIYMVDSSRVNLAGLNPSNMTDFCDALSQIVTK